MFFSTATSAIDLDKEDRYQFFLRYVNEHKLLWGLYHEGWAESYTKQRKKGLVLFPEIDNAEICIDHQWAKHTPRSIKLSSFLDRWVEKLTNQRYLIAVFPTPMDSPKFVDPEELSRVLYR